MPSKKFIVEWSESASNDLRSIIFHIAKERKKNAQDSFARIKKESLVLESFPDLGKVPNEFDKLQIGGFRELVISPWRVIYRKENNKVVVVAVVDSRRDLEDAVWNRMMYPFRYAFE